MKLKTEDSYHYFFKCPAYNTIREVLFENILTYILMSLLYTLDLLMFGNPNLDNMTKKKLVFNMFTNT